MVNLISHTCLTSVYSLKGKKEYLKLQSLLFSVFNQFFKKKFSKAVQQTMVVRYSEKSFGHTRARDQGKCIFLHIVESRYLFKISSDASWLFVKHLVFTEQCRNAESCFHGDQTFLLAAILPPLPIFLHYQGFR